MCTDDDVIVRTAAIESQRNAAWIKLRIDAVSPSFPLRFASCKITSHRNAGVASTSHDAALQIVVELARRFARFKVRAWNALWIFALDYFVACRKNFSCCLGRYVAIPTDAGGAAWV